MRVLILEPDWWTAALLADALTVAGHQVVGLAPSLVAALALAEAVPPDVAVIFRDLGQEGDGMPAARELRDRFGCPAVLTADRLDRDTAPVPCVMRGTGLHELLPVLEAAQRDGATPPSEGD